MKNSIYSEEDHFEELKKGLVKKKYDGYTITTTYITMRDGVKIAADIHMPEGLPSDEKVSCVLIQTRYWRATRFRFPFNRIINPLGARNHLKAFTSFGFALVSVDVRGTGASFGTRTSPWSEEEVKDSEDIVNWIISQPWSDGNVLPLGNSYSGTTAELTAVSNHPAVKGIIAMHNEINPYVDLTYPGGVLVEWFINHWGNSVANLDRNNRKGLGFVPWLIMKSVKPVELENREEILRKAIKEHDNNVNVAVMTQNINFIDDISEDGVSVKDFSVYRYKDNISKSKIPLYYWGSWMDAKTSSVVIESFLTFDVPFIGVIGAWTHGSGWKASPYLFGQKMVNPDHQTQFQAWAHFYDNCLNGNIPKEKVIFYYTIGEDKWKRTTTWPPEGQSFLRRYLSENNSLSLEKPRGKIGADNYKVDFSANTGKKTRWHTQSGGSLVIYKGRAEADTMLLTYTSEPLKEDIVITGYPIITLQMSSTHEDGAVFVYFEDVDIEGNVFLITEGQFRLIHRKISTETPPYNMIVPYHTYKRKDALPMIPRENAEVKFELIPTSIRIQKEHKLRIAIAGADKGMFARFPKEGNPTYTFNRNTSSVSYIDIPIIKE